MREVGCNHTIRPKTIRPMTNGPTYTKSSPIDFTLFVPLAAVVDDTPSARAMDPAAPRRGRLQIHLLVVALTVLVALVARSGAEVITLTEETFSDKIKEKDTVWFVQFCVPWCKHCKNLGTLWEDLGKVIEGEDEIEIGQVDCGVSKPVCSKVDIHSYPTFKVFYEGEEVAKYKGPRDVESLKNFVLNEAEKAGEAKLQAD